MGYRLANPWQVNPADVQPPAPPEALAIRPPGFVGPLLPPGGLPKSPPMVGPPVQPGGETAEDILKAHFGLTPVAPHSGMKDEAQVQSTEKAASDTHKNLYQTLSELLGTSANTAAIPEIQAQRASQDANRHLFEMQLAQPHQVDYASPLSYAAHAVDPRYGVIAPSQPSMTEKELREWAKQQQDDQRDLARTIIQGNNSQRMGFENNQLMSILGSKFGETAADPFMHPNNMEASNFFKWADHADKTMKPDQEAMREGEQLRTALKSGNIAGNSVPLMLAKMLTGASRVPVQEMLAEKGDPALEARVMQTWEKLSKGSITDQNKSEYLQFINQLMDLHQRGLQNHVGQMKSLGQSVGINPGRMDSYLAPNYVQPHAPPPAAPKAKKPALDLDAMFKEALDEERAARKK